MSYKIPELPSMRANKYELADYLELLCIVNNGNYSILNAHRQIDYQSDELEENILTEDDDLYDLLQEALQEIDRRKTACRDRYPFFTDNSSVSINEACAENHSLIYKYLLLATRLNMSATDRHKKIGDVDGTLIFEDLASCVGKQFLGENSDSLVFGTSASGGFEDKVNLLISRLGEGGSYKKPDESSNDEKDAGLDVVVWKNFADRNKGKLIAFAQCKTGTEWRDRVSASNPEVFCDLYFSQNPYVTPIRLFFVAESFKKNLEKISRDAGIVFDRCRIMDYLPSDVPSGLLAKISIWVNGNLPYVNEEYGYA